MKSPGPQCSARDFEIFCVLTAIVGLDESASLLRIEPLQGAVEGCLSIDVWQWHREGKQSKGTEVGVLKFGLRLAAIVVMSVECTAGRTVPLPRPSPARPSSEATVEPRGAPEGAPTACQLRLTPDRAVFEALGTIAGAGECGGSDIVLLKRVRGPPFCRNCAARDAALRDG
jgi:hypothetical protein